MADSGDYDVFLINHRGNIFSRGHTDLDPDSSTNFWDFSFEEFGEKDLPAAVKHILTEKKDHEKLSLVGFSQGTTTIMYALSPESKSSAYLYEHVSSATLLAPAVFF